MAKSLFSHGTHGLRVRSRMAIDLFNAGPPRQIAAVSSTKVRSQTTGGRPGGLGDWGSAAKPLTRRPIRLPMDPEMAVKMMAYKERQDAKLQRCANKIRWFFGSIAMAIAI